MSIATMVSLAVARGREDETADTRTRGERGESEEESKKSLDSVMAKVSAFVPSEINGIYVAGVGILSPKEDAEKWLIFATCLALIPLLIWLSYLDHKKHSEAKLSGRITLILLLFAVIAFVAWAAALPGTPFQAFSERATAIGGWAVAILAVVLYKAADALGIVPKAP
jgi:hypothetical protein